ncbi:hypothetical protein L249_3899 [Ophiocordyceps polyrhachis-furcata BCC 54312]|uniref:Uncharacterized protein n=1 Tax=Ophiocordyceps polyrhachis-furcata BCC 54312 TaxID=1330021 RepID=A0A367L6F3_9HYPO|nr:hypothetical protein L249_3899 [Ophiocordyceps polyrhachis-furcata BCC 54312]
MHADVLPSSVLRVIDNDFGAHYTAITYVYSHQKWANSWLMPVVRHLHPDRLTYAHAGLLLLNVDLTDDGAISIRYRRQCINRSIVMKATFLSHSTQEARVGFMVNLMLSVRHKMHGDVSYTAGGKGESFTAVNEFPSKPH